MHANSSSNCSPLKIALIGAGGFGSAHIRALGEASATGRAVLTDVIDPAPESIPEVELDLTEKGVIWHRSWEAFVESGRGVDAVAIAAPIQFHLPYTRAAYKLGLHVYLEKPPVPLVSELDDLIAMEGDDQRIQVGFGFIHSPQMKTLSAWIREGLLGDLISVRAAACWPRADRYYDRNQWAGTLVARGQPVLDGPATNALSHRVNDIMWIAAAFAGQTTTPVEITAELYRARPIESYDSCSMRGHFESGATFSIAVGHATKTHLPCEIHVVGTKASACLSGDPLVLTSDFSPNPITCPLPHLDLAYNDFFESIHTSSRPIQNLVTSRPYVISTNGMFVSTGEIHSLPESAFEIVEFAPEAGNIYHVDDLASLCRASLESGKTFSELGASWGHPATPIALDKSIATRLNETLEGWIAATPVA